MQPTPCSSVIYNGHGQPSLCTLIRLGGSILAAAILTSPTFAAAQPATSSQTSILADANSVPPNQHVGWPEQPKPPKGAPNILLILTDDVGFGSSSTFGGAIPTPSLDALAMQGVRYNRFNTTAVCSMTRAALLTGREPHSVGMGQVTNVATGYEGYTSVIPKSAAMISEVLRQNGYSTAAFGKWHLTPEWEASEIGPFDRWPTGQGFEYFYGYLNANNQWAPALVQNTVAINPPADDPSYELDKDLSEQTIKWIERHHALAPDKPFFAYVPLEAAFAHDVWRPLYEEQERRWPDGFKTAAPDNADREKWQSESGLNDAGTRIDSLHAQMREIRSILMEAPAPDQTALLWKLELILEDDDGSTSAWLSDYVEQTKQDCRRLLEEERHG